MRRKRLKSLKDREAVTGYLFIMPFVIGFLAFMVLPLIESFRMAFSQVVIGIGSGGFIMNPVGLDNFEKALRVDPNFVRWLTEDITRMLINVPATLIVSFFMALLINHKFKGRGLVRAIFFLPVILYSGVLIGLEFNNSLLHGMADYIQENANTASVTTAIRSILSAGGLGGRFFETVFETVDRVYDIVIASGIQVIIFLSGLQTIPKSMYEAAKIEGCTAWESFWKITLPMVSSIVLVNLVYTIIDFFMRSDSEVMNLITDTMVARMDYGFSSAMAWIYFVIVMLILGLSTGIVSKWVYYYD